MINVSVIGIVGVPACYGGFETLAENLLDRPHEGISYTVFCSARRYRTRPAEYKGARLVYLKPDANGAQSVLYDTRAMRLSLRSDVMLVLGVSGGAALPFIKRIYKGKIITNIDGLEWKRAKWGRVASRFLKFSERRAVQCSDVVIADNRVICDYVKSEYARDAVMIPYGGDQCKAVRDEALFEKYPFCRAPYAVSICRIEPENNIEEILKAFAGSKMHLVIAGNWDNSAYGKALNEKYGSFENITMLPPNYDRRETDFLRSNAALYVHGHSAGGTNPSLVEAMNLGLCVAAFDCDYNRATTCGKALYWVREGDIRRIAEMDDNTRCAVGRDMKSIALREYTWERVADAYSDLIRGTAGA